MSEAKILPPQFESVVGAIGETLPLFQVPVPPGTELRLDLSKMTYITSVGVKNWINWILKLPASSRLLLVECPFVMINQINTVYGFLPPQGKVVSFQAPFTCEKCGTECHLLLKNGVHFREFPAGEHPELPGFPCPKCGEIMEPDFDPAKALRFMMKA